MENSCKSHTGYMDTRTCVKNYKSQNMQVNYTNRITKKLNNLMPEINNKIRGSSYT